MPLSELWRHGEETATLGGLNRRDPCRTRPGAALEDPAVHARREAGLDFPGPPLPGHPVWGAAARPRRNPAGHGGTASSRAAVLAAGTQVGRAAVADHRGPFDDAGRVRARGQLRRAIRHHVPDRASAGGAGPGLVGVEVCPVHPSRGRQLGPAIPSRLRPLGAARSRARTG